MLQKKRLFRSDGNNTNIPPLVDNSHESREKPELTNLQGTGNCNLWFPKYWLTFIQCCWGLFHAIWHRCPGWELYPVLVQCKNIARVSQVTQARFRDHSDAKILWSNIYCFFFHCKTQMSDQLQAPHSHHRRHGRPHNMELQLLIYKLVRERSRAPETERLSIDV